MKNNWKIVKGVCAAAGFLSAMLAMGDVSASIIDAPHNESHDVRCGSCHAYSLWWQYSPASQSTSPGYASITDEVCNKCHGPTGAEFRKVSHSAASMGTVHNTLLGDWSTKCVDCHNPHLQTQLNWLSPSAAFGDGSMAGGLYLVEGTITGITDNGDGTTSINFTETGAKSPWQDTTLWSKKSGTANRGLMLSLGYATADKTYEINSVTTNATTPVTIGSPGTGEGTITIQSGNDPVPGTFTGSHFGIIYGQLVKSSINTPHSGAKAVEFFDPLDGLTDTGTTPKAICQVCHTQTTYWRNDGSLNTHNADTVCTACHPVATGFKPNFPDHDAFIAKNTTCGSCHTSPLVVEGIHATQCGACHLVGSIPDLKTASAGTPFRLTPTAWPTGSTPPNNGDCAQCHGSDYFDYHQNKNDHSGQVDKALPNCVTACHFHNKPDTIADIHKGNCSLCHDLSNGGVKISLAAQYGPGNCTNCHRDIAGSTMRHPNTWTHAGQVDRAPSCTDVLGCHPGDTVTEVHPQMCVTCHTSTYFGLRTTFTKAIAILPGTCESCHSQTAVDGHEVPPAP